MTVTTRRAALSTLAYAALVLPLGCSRAAPDGTPENVVRLFLEKMEAATDDPTKMKDAFALLSEKPRQNLEERAARASRIHGRRVLAYEMLATGRFGLRFRPKRLKAKISGDHAEVHVEGDELSQRAVVPCVREGTAWRVELELPDLPPLQRRDGT